MKTITRMMIAGMLALALAPMAARADDATPVASPPANPAPPADPTPPATPPTDAPPTDTQGAGTAPVQVTLPVQTPAPSTIDPNSGIPMTP